MQGERIRGCLFIADLELAEEIEPTVRHLDNPAARLEALVLLGLDLFAARAHVRDVAMAADDGIGLFADIARIGAEIFCHSSTGIGLMRYLAVQHRAQLADIMTVGANQHAARPVSG